MNVRLRAVGQMDRPSLAPIDAVTPGSRPDASNMRPVYFDVLGFTQTPIFARDTLRAGHTIAGPAIVEQLDTTTVIYPHHEVVVDAYGNLIMRGKQE